MRSDAASSNKSSRDSPTYEAAEINFALLTEIIIDVFLKELRIIREAGIPERRKEHRITAVLVRFDSCTFERDKNILCLIGKDTKIKFSSDTMLLLSDKKNTV